MSLLRTRILPILAILAVACAQMFGVQRGYVCDHHGAAVETMADHHHLGDDLHADHFDDFTPHHHGEEEETEDHAPLEVDMSVPQMPVPVSPQAVVTWLDDTLLEFLALTLLPIDATRVVKMPPDPGERSPPAAMVVAQCVVLLV